MNIHLTKKFDGPAPRYSALLSREEFGLAEYDTKLMELHDCVVAPTLGSILPYWLLVIPRMHKVNFSQWCKDTTIDPFDVVGELLDRIEVTTQRAIWFEHGPNQEGSVMGCGVDHAHLHVLIDPPFTFEQFSKSVQKETDLSWLECQPSEVYSSIPVDRSYLVAVGGKRAIAAKNVISVGSQFFRRIIAQLIGQPEIWNYKEHPHIENVRTTLRTYGSLTG